jgi:hypothetical protein
MSEAKSTSVIAPAVAIGLVIVSVLALIAFFALSAYTPDAPDDTGAQTHALSKSAIGFAGLRVLLNAANLPNEIDRGEAPHDLAHSSLTIVTPPAEAASADLAKLVTAPGDGRQWLIVLPKWAPLPDPVAIGRVMKGPLYGHGDVETLLHDLSKSTKIVRHWGMVAPELVATAHDFAPLPDRLGKVDALQTIAGPDWIALVSNAQGDAVLVKLKDRPVYVLSDPDFMNTHGLSDLPTAALALSMIRNLRSGNAPLQFEVTLNGLGSAPNLLRKLFEPPFLGATVCAILAAMLMGFHALVRFGSPPPAPPAFARGKAALVNNAADMIRMLHREPRMAQRYAQTTRNLALRALGIRRSPHTSDGDAPFQGIESRDRQSFSDLLRESEQVNSRAGLVTLARKFYEWRQGMFHAN